jgi:ribosomal peptide maturation radical SAM protein 1
MGALERPAFGLSLLKARLGDSGVPCDVRYLNFAFAEFVGAADYQWVMTDLPYTAFAGDWAFTRTLYGERPEADRRYVDEVLRATWRLPEEDVARILRVRRFTTPFIDHCLAAVPWEEYAVIGFTSTFEQNIASLALARRVKEAHPRVAIAFGGANWEAVMGLELHRQFPFVDYVCSGEAEESFPALVRAIAGSEPVTAVAARIPGVVYRRAGESIATGPPAIARDLDALPVPDYSDYFRDLAESSATSGVTPTLLFESSRGCWWGAKSHCTFCGLNGGTMAFRSKSASRVLAELDTLTARWKLDRLETVDNIMDMKYFKEVLPALAQAGKPWRLFYEVKANLSRHQVALLRDAGVYRIQPGIESLSDHVLRLMRKGTTGLRNIQLLKWCREYGIEADWNLLYGFPGETPDDYARTLELLPSVRFLGPPAACGPVRLDRFSPYHDAPAAFGLVHVRPLATYRHLYPFDENALGRIAYYFDYDFTSDADLRSCAGAVVAYVEAWRMNPEAGSLTAIEQPDGSLALRDTRVGATVPEVVLTGPDRAAYVYCDELRTTRAVVDRLWWEFPDIEITDAQVVEFLDSLVANRLMVTDGVHYLSLAIRVPEISAAEGPPRRAYPGRPASTGPLLELVGPPA